MKKHLNVKRLKKMSKSDLAWLVSHVLAVAKKNREDEFKSDLRAYLACYEREDIEEEESLKILFDYLKIKLEDMFLE